MEAIRVRTFSRSDKDACLAVFDSNRPTFFSAAERPQVSAFLDHLPGPDLVLEDASGRVVACGGYAVESGAAQASFCWGMVEQPRHGQGLGRHSAPEILAIARRDLDALSDFLGDRQYFRGERVRTLDVVAYAFLAEFILPPIQ